jgi:hypothetical protein
VTGDGEHTLQFRSVDKLGHLESTRTLMFKIDATAPLIAGMPVSCAIWPPNDKMVEVATVTMRYPASLQAGRRSASAGGVGCV